MDSGDLAVGFQDDGTGVRRWWDGEKFTNWTSTSGFVPNSAPAAASSAAVESPRVFASPPPIASSSFWTSPRFMGITLSGDQVRHGSEGGSVQGAVARVELGGDLKSRLTVTRMVTLGIFALAAPKKSGHLYLTIEHPDYFIQVQLPVSREGEARRFAARVNQAARQ